jgi:sugar/nucleoside kinase (ribokinase family)
MYDVACVGILVADAITQTVDKIPEKGKLGLVDSLKLYSGGCAMNAAIDLAKIGANVTILGMTGNDGFGSFLYSELEKYGIDTKGLIINDNVNTSASVVLIDSSGERTFLHSIGANGVFSEQDINYDIISNSKIVFVAGSMLMPSFDGIGCANFLKKAKEAGKITVLDTAWDDKGRWMSVLEPCLSYLDYFLPSIEEAQQLSGQAEPEEIAKVFFEGGVKSIVIKLGKDGCYMQEDANSKGVYIPTYSQIKPVDTTGAGDSFCAGFIYGLSAGMDMQECCRFANAVGTHCIMETGASTGIKPYAEILKFMEENEV